MPGLMGSLFTDLIELFQKYIFVVIVHSGKKFNSLGLKAGNFKYILA